MGALDTFINFMKLNDGEEDYYLDDEELDQARLVRAKHLLKR